MFLTAAKQAKTARTFSLSGTKDSHGSGSPAKNGSALEVKIEVQMWQYGFTLQQQKNVVAKHITNLRGINGKTARANNSHRPIFTSKPETRSPQINRLRARALPERSKA